MMYAVKNTTSLNHLGGLEGEHVHHHQMNSIELAALLLYLHGLEMLKMAWIAHVFCLSACFIGDYFLNLQQNSK